MSESDRFRRLELILRTHYNFDGNLLDLWKCTKSEIVGFDKVFFADMFDKFKYEYDYDGLDNQLNQLARLVREKFLRVATIINWSF